MGYIGVLDPDGFVWKWGKTLYIYIMYDRIYYIHSRGKWLSTKWFWGTAGTKISDKARSRKVHLGCWAGFFGVWNKDSHVILSYLSLPTKRETNSSRPGPSGPQDLANFIWWQNVAINPFTPKHWPCSFWEVDFFCWHFEGMGLVDIVCTPKQSKQSTYRTEDLELCAGFAGLHNSFLALWSRGPALKHGDGRFHGVL